MSNVWHDGGADEEELSATPSTPVLRRNDERAQRQRPPSYKGGRWCFSRDTGLFTTILMIFMQHRLQDLIDEYSRWSLQIPQDRGRLRQAQRAGFGLVELRAA